MRTTITIQAVSVYKTGVSASGDWALLSITDTQGKGYQTFLSLYEGKTYDVEVESVASKTINKKTGKPFVNLKITKIYPAGESVGSKPSPTPSPAVLELLTLTRENNQMLKDLTMGLAEKAELPDVK